MDKLEIFKEAMQDYKENYYVLQDLKNKELKNNKKGADGAKSTFGIINRVVQSIYHSKESDDIKSQKLLFFKSYINRNNDKKILDINANTFKAIYNIIFSNNVNNMNIENLAYYVSYMDRFFKSGISGEMLSVGLNREMELVKLEEKIKREKEEELKQKLAEEKAKKLAEEKARQEREQALKEEKLSKMSADERFKFGLDELKTDDEKEKYVTDKFNQLKTMQESEERKLLAKVVIKYYKDKEKPSKKVKKKIEELEKIL